MSTSMDVVKRAYKAWETKDEATLLEVLSLDYRAIIPGGMSIEGHEGVKKMLKQCPDDVTSKDEQYIEQGDKIVRIWTCVFTQPSSAAVRMAELNVVKDGKVVFNEAFMDTAALPKEFEQKSESDKDDFASPSQQAPITSTR
jgi:ketosteroid isomerase-like protein